ncbi:MAG: DUF3108 domain-containing protein [Chitinophagaceae bacterium]
MQKLLIGWLLCMFAAPASPDEGLEPVNRAFHAGETVSYTVYYTLAGVYVNAGTAIFTTQLTQLQNKPVFHLKGEGNSNSKYDWIFKVRDKYESFVDTANLQPLQFVRNIQEGSYKKYENVSFNHTTGTAVTNDGVYKVPHGVQDVISMVYSMRNTDFDSYKIGDTIPFSMFLDNEVYHLYIRYTGKESVKTKYGKFKALKLKPLLLKGALFQGGEEMDVWVSDDANHIPLRIQTPISVGKIKVDMMYHRNLRHPLSSFVDF